MHLFNIKKNITYYARGRDALWNSLEVLGLNRGDVIVLPSYLCPAVIQPIQHKGLRIRFYRIKKDMQADLEDLIQKICPQTKAVLIIHYFGFPQPLDEIMSVCKKFGLSLIEDCAHVLMGQFHNQYLGAIGDAAVFSFKKVFNFIPGNGAALVTDKKSMQQEEFDIQDYVSSNANMLLSRSFLRKMQLFILQYKPCRSFIDAIIRITDFTRLKPNSKISQAYLNKIMTLDYRTIINRCRNNFILLLNNIIDAGKMIPVFPNLPPDVCPLVFPVYVDKRDGLYKTFLKNGIRTFILWEFLPKEISRDAFPDSGYIRDHILLFPVNDWIDIKKIKQIIYSYKRW